MADLIDVEIEGLSRFREIGSGGFSTVYAAWDEGFQRWVAVKVLPKLDDDGRRRFDRERALMGQLDDLPNVVTPFGSGYTASGDGYLVMEYVAGDSLRAVLDRRGSLSIDESIEYILPIIDAAGEGHRRGILHLDIKPANILLTADDIPKLADFGIGATRDATTTVAAFTLAHAAPESFADGFDRQDERSDLYALASTLYTLIRGRPPFAVDGQDSTRAHMMRILSHSPPPIGRPELDEFFAVGLAKEPDDRFQSAAELESAVRSLRAASEPTFRPTAPQPASTATIYSDSTLGSDSTIGSDSADDRADAAAHLLGDDAMSGYPDERVLELRSQLRTKRRSAAQLVPAAALLLLGVGGGVVLFADSNPSSEAAGSPTETILVGESTNPPTPPVSIPPPGGGATPTGAAGPGSTAPGPGSFSIGQLKLGLLEISDLPAGWTDEGDQTVTASEADLPCGAPFAWTEDTSSAQALGTFLAPDDVSNVEHTVWAMDEWVAADFFIQAGVTPPCDGDVERGIVPSPPVGDFGTQTIVYSVETVLSGEVSGRSTTVLTRCDGLISRLVITSTDESPEIDELTSGLSAVAYERLVDTAEWENATCPPG